MDKKLDELLEAGIIEPVIGHSSWVSPMVIVTKDKGSEAPPEIYADRRHAADNPVEVGSKVVIKDMVPSSKLALKYKPEEFEVVDRNGSELLVKSSIDGRQYRRNVTHTKLLPSANETIQVADGGLPTEAPKQNARPKRTVVKPARYQ